MCGIAGIVATEPPDASLVGRMCDAMAGRGPHGHGLHVDDRAVLGARLPAGVDAAGRPQPVRNEDDTVVAVAHGEFYNAAELRTGLLRRGHRLRTPGDAECLVHLYEECGDDLVYELRGRFAFALWDTRRRRLLLGRDRVGRKPLYWRAEGTGIVFTSEAAPLLEDPRLVRRMNLVALHHYLTYRYVPAPWSIYQDVHKLPPGHLLSWQDGGSRVYPYWRLDRTPQPVDDEHEAAARLRGLLLDAVRLRMVAQRPLGALLSGGVDSSAVVAAMAQQSARPVKTFSVGFDDQRFDERFFARAVADRYGTDHHEMVVTAPALDLLPELAWHFDEPFADPSAIPGYYLSRLGHQQLTVVQSGDGGDECFGGYRRMRALRIPALHPARGFDQAGTPLPAPASPRGRLRGLGHAIQLLGRSAPDRCAPVMPVFTVADRQRLYTDDLRAELAAVPGLELPAGVDTPVMASLEARSPYLDHTVLEWAAHLPMRMKVRGHATKYLLRRAVAPWLPPDVAQRPKRNLGVPLDDWLRGELRELAWSVLTDDTARSRGLFRPEAVTDLLRRHDQGVDESRRLWALVQFELWYRHFLDPAAAPARPAQADGGLLARRP